MKRVLDAGLVILLLGAIIYLYRVSSDVKSLERTIDNRPASAGQQSFPLDASMASFSSLAEDGSISVFSPATDSYRFTYVIVFRSDCPYCEATAPIWASFSKSKPDSVRLVAVSVETRPVAQTWLARHGIAVDQIVIPSDIPTFASAWSLSGVPTTYVLDASGVVTGGQVGALRSDQVEGSNWRLRPDAAGPQ